MAAEQENRAESLELARDRVSRSRSQWRTWHVVTLIVIASLMLGLIAIFRSVPSSPGSASSGTAAPEVASARACGSGDAVSDRDAAVSGDVVLRQAPGSGAPPIVKPGSAPDAKDAAVFATINGSVPLREMCRSGAFARVRGLTNDLRWMEGWVPVRDLKALAVDGSGRRVYERGDIEWQPGSERDKAAIVAVANTIMREDKRCEAIDPQSLLVEGHAGDRRYTISCAGPGGSFPIAFSAADAKNGRSFAMAAVDPEAQGSVDAPIAKSDAVPACIAAIDAQLTQPRSADYHTFTDTTFTTDGSRARLTIGLSAKNGFGNEIDQTAECMFEGDSLTSAEVIP